LDALAEVILSLSNMEIQYLIALQNENCLSRGERVSDNMVISTGEEKQDLMEYIYQKKWMGERWKDYHILTSLYSDEEDKQGSEKVEKKEKETYEFELTSIDASHKIKIIKIIRELLGLGLKDAKDIVDKAPYVFKKGKK
jgi:hypothetical protein